MYNLLLIDDEAIIRKGLNVIIRREFDFIDDIYEAENGKVAIEILESKDVHIVITDILMPFVDGLDFISKTFTSFSVDNVIILSGYDDFNFAKRAMKYGVKEYLLKPIDTIELKKSLYSIIRGIEGFKAKEIEEKQKSIQIIEGNERIKENSLRELVKTKGKDNIKTLSLLFQNTIASDHVLFNIIVIDFKFMEMILDEKECIDELKIIVQNTFKSAFENSVCFIDENNKIVLLYAALDDIMLELKIKKIQTNISILLHSKYKIRIFFGVGKSVDSLENIKSSYTRAIKATYNKIYDQKQEIHFYQSSLVEKNYKFLDIPFQQILRKLERGVLTYELNSLTKDFLITLFEGRINASKPFEYLENFNMQMYNYFEIKGIKLNEYFEDANLDFLDIYKCWSFDQLLNYEKKYFTKIGEQVLFFKNSHTENKLIYNVLEFINENYSENINLNYVADYFNKSNSYLSVQFKKITGKTFVDYLTNIRIEKSKELMKDSNLKIQEISEMVGYVNSKHFCTVFKKNAGLSPNEYRKNIL